MGVVLGGFELERRVGRGAVGTVWRARHRRTRVRAAVKVLHAGRAAMAREREAFDLEIRLAARVHHPGIAAVLELGLVPDHGGEGPAPGSPWFAATWADAGTLEDWGSSLRGPALHRWLREVLGALAHAHARGLLHRDVKPGNLLFRRTTDGGSRALLTDFGIGAEGARGPAAGSPGTAAPEQAIGGREGPWTDLFGLGQTVCWVCTSATVPPGSRPELPDGLGPWVARCIASRPEDRFPSVAAAVRALDHIAAAPPTRRLPPATALAPGLTTLGLRAPQLVGRHAIRGVVESALVEAGGGPRVVLVEGRAGSGRTALLGWAREHAETVAGVASVRAGHAASASDEDGLPGLVAALFRVPPGTPLDVAHGYIGAELRRTGAVDLRDAADLSRIQGGLAVRGGPGRRMELVCRTVERVAGPGAVVTVDDAERSAESLRFVAHVLRTEPRPRLLLLVAVATEVSEEVQALLAELVLEGASRLELGPLDAAAGGAMVDGLVRLSPGLREQLLARCGGQPGAIRRRLLDWRDQGLLVEGEAGAVLSGPEPVRLAGAAAQQARVASLGIPGAREALVVAAVLGGVVDDDTWERAAAEAGVPVPPRLRAALLDRGLATAEGRGRWRFADPEMAPALTLGVAVGPLHAACADALHPDGPAAGARQARHAVLGGRPGAVARLRRLLRRHGGRADVTTGELVASTALAVAQELGDTGLEGAALRVLGWVRTRSRSFSEGRALCARALALATPLQDRETIALASLQLADIARFQGDFDEARQLLDGAAASLDASLAWVAPHLRSVEAGLAMVMGDVDAMAAVTAASLGAALTARQRLAAHLQHAEAMVYLRRHDDAAASLALSAADVGAAGLEEARLTAYLEGQIAWSRGELELATVGFTRARDLALADGHLGFGLGCRSQLAEVARADGRLDEAESAYAALVATHDRRGNPHSASVARINLALVALARGSCADADAWLDGAGAGVGGGSVLASVLLAVRAAVAAERGDLRAMERCMADVGHRDLLAGDTDVVACLARVERAVRQAKPVRGEGE